MTEPAVSHPFRVDALPARKPTRFDLVPDTHARTRLAEALDILSIDALRFRGELRPAGKRDWILDAVLVADVTQACVVTLEPVPARIEEEVTRRYVADLPAPTSDEIEMPDETVEPLPVVIDAGAVMIEALTLALPPFPRAPGAAFAGAFATRPGAEPLTETEVRRPFAGLADLMKKGGDEG
ncbi:MAG: DUF177 domain-containing protein [Rhodobacteraceae bacterium]|nr:DUF177 domain-containing protein [Paracoccaceae bacterium]